MIIGAQSADMLRIGIADNRVAPRQLAGLWRRTDDLSHEHLIVNTLTPKAKSTTRGQAP
jgi:hypothetical protein